MRLRDDGTRELSVSLFCPGPGGARVGMSAPVLIPPGVRLEGREPFLSAGGTLVERYEIEVVGWTEPGIGHALNYTPLRAVYVPRLEDIISLEILAHEIAHYELGHSGSGRVWSKELAAESWALERVEELEFATDSVRAYVERYVTRRLIDSLGHSSNPEAAVGEMIEALPAWTGAEVPVRLRAVASTYARRRGR